jgi:hypothetical protein
VTLAEHAASIAHDHCSHPDRLTVWRYANLAAKWSLLRLQRYRKESGDTEERQFAVLTAMVRDQTAALGLSTCTDAGKTEAKIGNKIPRYRPVSRRHDGEQTPAPAMSHTCWGYLAGERCHVARPLRLTRRMRPVGKCPICTRPVRADTGRFASQLPPPCPGSRKAIRVPRGRSALEALGGNRFHDRADLRPVGGGPSRRRRRRGGSSDSHRASDDGPCLLLPHRYGSHRADGDQAARDCPRNEQLDTLVPD